MSTARGLRLAFVSLWALPLGGCIVLTAPPVLDPYAGVPPAPIYGAPTYCPSPGVGALAGAWQGGFSGAMIGSFWGDAGRAAAIGAGIGAIAGAVTASAACE